MKAAALVGMELVWLRDLVCELGVEQGCVRVMEDNAGCVALAHGQKDTSKRIISRGLRLMWIAGLVGRAGGDVAGRCAGDVQPGGHFHEGAIFEPAG